MRVDQSSCFSTASILSKSLVSAASSALHLVAQVLDLPLERLLLVGVAGDPGHHPVARGVDVVEGRREERDDASAVRWLSAKAFICASASSIGVRRSASTWARPSTSGVRASAMRRRVGHRPAPDLRDRQVRLPALDAGPVGIDRRPVREGRGGDGEAARRGSQQSVRIIGFLPSGRARGPWPDRT